MTLAAQKLDTGQKHDLASNSVKKQQARLQRPHKPAAEQGRIVYTLHSALLAQHVQYASKEVSCRVCAQHRLEKP